MSEREFFIYTLDDELPRFKRVFEALPEDKLDFRPHPVSRTAMAILVTMVAETSIGPAILEKGIMDITYTGEDSRFKNGSEAWQAFDKNYADIKKLAQEMNDSEWNGASKAIGEEWETTKGKMIWALLLDQIHHRGQLSTYIRQMGGKVPPIYGPSGDSK